jgi:hypothetical protein
MSSVLHKIDKHGILWQIWNGETTMEDLVEVASLPVTEANDSPIRCAISDFRQVNFSVAPAEVWKLVEKFQEAPDRRRGWRWAVLAEQPDHVGLVTLFQHRGQNISMEVELFATEEAAVEWLLRPRPSDD